MDQWTSCDSIFGLPELTGTTHLFKRKKGFLNLQLSTPTSDHDILEPTKSSGLKKQHHSLENFSEKKSGSVKLQKAKKKKKKNIHTICAQVFKKERKKNI